MMMNILRKENNDEGSVLLVNGAMPLEGELAKNVIKGLWNSNFKMIKIGESIEVTPTRFASLLRGV